MPKASDYNRKIIGEVIYALDYAGDGIGRGHGHGGGNGGLGMGTGCGSGRNNGSGRGHGFSRSKDNIVKHKEIFPMTELAIERCHE